MSRLTRPGHTIQGKHYQMLSTNDSTNLLQSPEQLNYKLQDIWRRDDGIVRTLDILPLVKEQIGGSYHVNLEFQGRLVKTSLKYTTQQNWKRGQRGQVFNFSSASRKRLMELFARLEMRQKAVFLTLTYGKEYPDAKTAKNNLRAFFERLRRKLPRGKTSAIWRLEFQERGAPHFHIVLFDLPFIKKEDIQETWGEIIGIDRPFTRIEMIHSAKKLVNYVSKYVAKMPEPPPVPGGFNSPSYLHAYNLKHGDGIGRVWGVFNRSNLPFAELIEFTWPTAKGTYMRFRHCAIQEYPPIEQQRGLGFTLYVRSSISWHRTFTKCQNLVF